MKKYRLLSLAFLSLAFCCTRIHKRYVVKVQPTQLNDSTLYDADAAQDAIFDAEESGTDSIKNLARKIFLDGVDLYVNKKNYPAAVKQFKRALMVYPTAQAYYELGCALEDLSSSPSSNKEAIAALQVALKLDFKPDYMVTYKIARAEAIDPQGYAAYQLNAAARLGFSDTSAILKDERFASFVKSPDFVEFKGLVLATAARGDQHRMFDAFLQNFPDLPASGFTVPREGVAMKNYSRTISYAFHDFVPEMANVSFGRDVSHEFYFVGKLDQTPVYTVVIYTSKGFDVDDMQPVFTYIVTYDKEGKVVASKVLSGQFSAEKLRTARYINGEFTVEDYHCVWEQPIDKVSFDHNKVKQYDLVANATFVVQPDGTITAKEKSGSFSETAATGSKK